MNRFADARTSRAARDSGTRCRRPAFIRSADTVHMARRTSISSQIALRTSADRLAVSTRKRKASFVVVAARDPWDRVKCRGDIAVRQCAMVLDPTVLLRQCRAEHVAARVVGTVALGDRPLHDRADAMAYPPGGFGLGRPDREKDGHHIGGRDLADLSCRPGAASRSREGWPATGTRSCFPAANRHDGWRWTLSAASRKRRGRPALPARIPSRRGRSCGTRMPSGAPRGGSCRGNRPGPGPSAFPEPCRARSIACSPSAVLAGPVHAGRSTSPASGRASRMLL